MTFIEPAYAASLDWLLCDALGQIAAGAAPAATAAPAEDGAYYFRLSTRPIDQAPFEAARARLGDAVLRRQVVAGAYRLVDAHQAYPRPGRRPGGAARRLRRGAAGGAGRRRRSWPRRASPRTWST